MTESENRGDQTKRIPPVYGIAVPTDSTDVVPEDNEA